VTRAQLARLSHWQEIMHRRLEAQGNVVLTIYSIEDLRQGLRAVGVQAP
jgi:hypothetical protein